MFDNQRRTQTVDEIIGLQQDQTLKTLLRECARLLQQVLKHQKVALADSTRCAARELAIESMERLESQRVIVRERVIDRCLELDMSEEDALGLWFSIEDKIDRPSPHRA